MVILAHLHAPRSMQRLLRKLSRIFTLLMILGQIPLPRFRGVFLFDLSVVAEEEEQAEKERLETIDMVEVEELLDQLLNHGF